MVKWLSSKQAKDLLFKYGKNEIKAKKKTPLWKKFLSQFTDPMVIILIVAGIIALVVAYVENSSEDLMDAYVILGIVCLNAVIGFVQEFKTEKAVEALQKMVSPKSKVWRNGQVIRIESGEIVPGDILILAEGDKVTADGILLESNSLEVQEAVLTGESCPVSKKSFIDKDLLSKDFIDNIELFKEKFPKIKNVQKVFMGTNITLGSAKVLVVNTALQTEFGKIANLTDSAQQDLSPLQKELKNMGAFVGKITVVLSVILLIVGIVIQNHSFVNSLLFSVSVAVAAVPEGLPATITISLAIAVQKMIKKQAIVKKLSSIETLGCTTMICSDKTGTLTKNEMTVKKITFSQGEEATISGRGYQPTGDISFVTEVSKDRQEILMQVADLCNESSLYQNKDGLWEIVGDPTEGALKTVVKKSGFDFTKKEVKKIFPFDSSRKMMSVITNHNILVKGATEQILDKSEFILTNEGVRKITEEDKRSIREQLHSLAGEALRVLAMAYRQDFVISDIKKNEQAEQKLIFIWLVGMIDPPKKGVKEAVEMCHQAGIKINIVTGDYGLTAKAIAQKIGLKGGIILEGKDIWNISDEELTEIMDKNREIIFARVKPADKMRIVDLAKKKGEVVAVTGDGVNDAPALKRADIGIAMGIVGTDVSKEAANMILVDDNFASIVKAIKEGRTVYDNLKKFTWFIFSCNIGELITIFLAIVLMLPSPLTAVLILSVNVGTDLFPALALWLEATEPGTMNKAPRNPKSRIMNKDFIGYFVFMGMMIGCLVLFSYLLILWQGGWNWWDILTDEDPIHIKGMSVAFSVLVMTQVVNAYNSKSLTNSLFKLKTNYWLHGASLISIALVYFIVETPVGQKMMHTVGLDWQEWLLVGGLSLLMLLFGEGKKFIFNRKQKNVKTIT